MLFNSIEFVVFFILVVTLIFTIKKQKFQHTLLLLASYFFFYYSSNYLITLLIFTTVWDFYFGKLIFETNRWLRGWDGNYQGRKQPTAAYVWMVKGTDKYGKVIEKKGTVLLLR